MTPTRTVRDLQVLVRDAQRQTERARAERNLALEHLEEAKAVFDLEKAAAGTDEDLARATLRLRNCSVTYESAHGALQAERSAMVDVREELAVAKGERRRQVPTFESGDTSGRDTSQNDTVLLADKVSKKFSGSLRQSLRRGLFDLTKLSFGRGLDPGQLRPGEFWAVDGVSVELKRGESLGILGPNGSGKTTLSRILAGVFPPDIGEVTIRGRMTSILTVGAGFHPHLNGLENIRLNGAVLGLTDEEVSELIPGIIEFAGLGERISKPVGMYSSGMRMRLGFSVVTASRPDLMIFDEVLAVGDLDFRAKCIDRLTELRETSALIMVAQTPNMVETFCSEALWIDDGKEVAKGSIEEIGPRYVLAHSASPANDLDDPIDLR